MRKTALVLGGGGMFGAYEAGVWQALHRHFTPAIVAGASIGALNAWAIAGQCPPEEWVAQWLDMRAAAEHRWRLPRSPLDGFIDREAFESFIRGIHSRFTPRIPCAVTVTDLLSLRPYAVVTPNVEWIHLAASCAVPVVMPQYRIGGRIHSDGGLLGSVPVWAALELGATKIVAVNILPRGGPAWLRAVRSGLRSLSPYCPPLPDRSEVFWIEHATALGTLRDTASWSRFNAERWVECGRRDTEAALPALRKWLNE